MKKQHNGASGGYWPVQKQLSKEQQEFLEEILEGKHIPEPLSEEDKEIMLSIIKDFGCEK